MRVAIGIGGMGSLDGWKKSVEFVAEAEKLGVYSVWSAEAWGSDAVTPLAYLAARTERIMLGSGIMQITSRTPAMTAQTALTMAAISGNRFILGLGTSGPQVVEGLHGHRFAEPYRRLRETIDVIKLVLSGQKVEYAGRHHVLPLPGGEGKALRVSLPPNEDIPIYLATLSPMTLELTGEVADGWVGTSFVPDSSNEMVGHIARGAEKAGRRLSAIDLMAGGDIEFTDDVEAAVAARKRGMAFSMGGMGSPTTNFYNNAYRRQGFEEVAKTVQRLWTEGKRDDAAAAVPDEMVLATSMIGDDATVRRRMRDYKEAGVTTLRSGAPGATMDERLANLERIVKMAEDLD